jgi:hypothetical protein
MIWNVRCSFLLMGCWSYFEFFDDKLFSLEKNNKSYFIARRVWRYQRGNRNPYIEEKTTQWPQEKAQRTNNDLQNLTLMIWNVRCSFLLMGCWSYFEFFDDICNFDFCLICNYSPFSYVHLLFLCIIFIYILYISKTVLIYHILYFYISRCDNKSASHWIMFDYFFHVWKLNIFYLFMFLIYSCQFQTI